MLDWVPARLRVIRTTRPKYACRVCNKVVQAAAPERPIAGGLATPALLAKVLISKYCDHTPLYRQSQIFARHGVEIERSTLTFDFTKAAASAVQATAIKPPPGAGAATASIKTRRRSPLGGPATPQLFFGVL